MMMMMMGRFMMLFSAVMMILLVVTSSATMEQDEKDCADQLQNLASCIAFVSGDAKKPTPQCCEDMEGVRRKKPKCLCVLIKQSTDPSMALPINTTLALQMPSACNIPAKISDCPRLLKISPDSPDAKIFKEASAGNATSSSTSAASSSTSPGKDDSKVTPKNDGGRLLRSSLQVGSAIVAMASFACIVV